MANEKSSDAAFLRISNLTKKFGQFVALKDVSLDIHENEFICFLGPSGCGKTTLLRAIAGLDIQTSGTVEQAGIDISAFPPSKRDFGIVFQSYALFPNLSVTKNVGYGLENRKLPAKQIQTRVRELLELVGLPDQGDKYPAALSGGQQQRVALARALATSPGLLLLDEPLSALDAKVRTRLRTEIKDLQRRLQVTTIMVTHDQEEALTMADRIVVMNQGIIEQVGTPKEIYSTPASSFVADFIGTMNFLSAVVEKQGTLNVGDSKLTCNTDGIEGKTSVFTAIRPEDISLLDTGVSGENVVEVTIKHLEFLGSFYRVGLVSPQFGDTEVRADFSVNVMRSRGIDIGDKVSIRFPPELLLLFPAA